MTLIEQIRNGENAALEFKEARPKDALKFVKTVVAFANGRGGRILFGVEDGTGSIVGIDRAVVQREMDVIADTIANVCTPRICPKLMLANVDGKSVIVVDVPQGDSTPYYARCAQAGIPPPLVEERGGCLCVTFYRPVVADGVNRGVNGVNRGVNGVNRGVNGVGSGVNAIAICLNQESSIPESVIRLIQQDNRISAARIASVLGIGNRTAQRALKNLQSACRISRVGGTRGHWEVAK